MLKKLPVNIFGWIENTSQFNEDFTKKNYKDKSDKGYYCLEVDVQFPEKLHEFHNDLPSLPERTKSL